MTAVSSSAAAELHPWLDAGERHGLAALCLSLCLHRSRALWREIFLG